MEIWVIVCICISSITTGAFMLAVVVWLISHAVSDCKDNKQMRELREYGIERIPFRCPIQDEKLNKPTDKKD